MNDLTQKILDLDSESMGVLKRAEAKAAEMKKKADLSVEKRMKEAEEHFRDEKRHKLDLLHRKHEAEEKKAFMLLDQKMQTFRKDLPIEKVVEALLQEARDHICR